jgi:hypothetical protein
MRPFVPKDGKLDYILKLIALAVALAMQAFAAHAQPLQDTAGGGITREVTGLHPIERQHPKGEVLRHAVPILVNRSTGINVFHSNCAAAGTGNCRATR